MNNIKIIKSSITELEVDAIVNAANERLLPGGGVCGAIFKKARYLELESECKRIGHCDTGKAVITNSCGLKSKYIIHAVGPIWYGGNKNEEELLYGAYVESIKLAIENKCKSIAFPLISSGIYGYPMEEAWKVAIRACKKFDDIEIYFAVIDEEIKRVGEEILG